MTVKKSLGMPRISWACASFVFVTACADVPAFVSLNTPLPVAFATTPDVTLPHQVDVLWWRNLNDPILDMLISKIYDGNLTLAIADLRVKEAEALRGALPGGLTITGDTSQRAQRDINADQTETGNVTNIGVQWLFDPGGRRAASAASAQNNIVSAKAEVASARQFAASNLANAYIDLRFQQARRTNLLSEIQGRRATISQQERSAEAGNVTEIDLTNARAQLAARQAELPIVEAEIEILKNQIAVLAGVAPGMFDIDLSQLRQQPLPTSINAAGLPADLLRNRADLFLLERAYYNAVLGVSQARADLYPSLSLGGSLAVNTIGSDSRIAGFGPRLELPALPTGPVQGRIEAAEVRVQIAFEEWKQASLAAVSDAEAALLQLKANAEALRFADQNVALSRRSLDLTKRVLAFDGATLGDVTVAENRVSEAVNRQSRLRQNYARAYVDLQVQLGSGEVLALGLPEVGL